MTDRSKIRAAVVAVVNAGERQRRIAYGGQCGGMDAKRGQAWAEYGYRPDLTTADYRAAWERGGVAFGAVEKVLGKVWATAPWVIEGDPTAEATAVTAWEAEIAQWADDVGAWAALRHADRMRMLGGWAGLVVRIADGKRLDQPVKRISSLAAIVELVPVYRDQLTVIDRELNEASADYGKPRMWSYTEPASAGLPAREVQVHADRLIVVGDPRLGVPFLRAGYNDLVNIEKILGGSGEAFLKNSARHLNINFNPDVQLQQLADAYGVPVAEINEIFNEVTREINAGNDAAIITQGATVTPLVATAPDPRPAFEVAIQSFSAATDIASKILIGNQTGERASTEDLRAFNERCQADRVAIVGASVRALIQRLIQLGALERRRFSVMWDDLTAQTPSERIATAKVMAETNQLMQLEGGLYTREQILLAAGVSDDD